MSGPYDDIIGLARPVSTKHPRMPAASRAAQFLSFAALSGFEGAIGETARQTEKRVELEEDDAAALNEKLRLLLGAIDSRPEVAVTYFQPDDRKGGGAYVTLRGRLRRVVPAEGELVFVDGQRVGIADILNIERPPEIAAQMRLPGL